MWKSNFDNLIKDDLKDTKRQLKVKNKSEFARLRTAQGGVIY